MPILKEKLEMKNSLCAAYSLFDLYLILFKKETKSAEMHIYITIKFWKKEKWRLITL